MPIFGLTQDLLFPPGHLADESGIIATGGDLRAERLLLAYQNGIFPWPHEGYPLLWFCPPERFVLYPDQFVLNRSLKKAMRKNHFEIRFDTCFLDVMKACQSSARTDQDSTWISDEMIVGYSELHKRGFAHSVESYLDGQLVGGFYGVSLGKIFFGESMFAKAPDASKVAFATLVAHLVEWNFDLIDCQAPTDHLKRFGASLIPRDRFLKIIATSQTKGTRTGNWSSHFSAAQALGELTRTCTQS